MQMRWENCRVSTTRTAIFSGFVCENNGSYCIFYTKLWKVNQHWNSRAPLGIPSQASFWYESHTWGRSLQNTVWLVKPTLFDHGYVMRLSVPVLVWFLSMFSLSSIPPGKPCSFAYHNTTWLYWYFGHFDIFLWYYVEIRSSVVSRWTAGQQV